MLIKSSKSVNKAMYFNLTEPIKNKLSSYSGNKVAVAKTTDKTPALAPLAVEISTLGIK